MDLQERVAAAAGRLKVFPLPSVVLFPHAAVPLHIFEPRYRAMVRDCLDGDRVIGLAQLQPGWEGDYAGRPPLHPMVCAGVVVWHDALEDGRFNIMVQGASRVRVTAELPAEKDYREVAAELLEDPPYRGPEEEALRQAVLDIAGRVPAGALDGLLGMAVKRAGGALADVVAGGLVADLERRMELLCELDVGERLRAVLSEVSELIARLGPPRPGTLN